MNTESTINIRMAEEQDAHAIATIHVASWQKIYHGHIPNDILDKLSVSKQKQKWHELISNHVKILVIEKNNLIVGFTSLCPSRDSDTDPKKCGEISAIYLHPDVWHQGLGKKLCSAALIELEKMGFNEVVVWVLEENKQARKFYERLSFNNIGDIKAIKIGNEVILNEIRYNKKLSGSF